MIKNATLLILLLCLTFAPLFSQDVNDKENLVNNGVLEGYSGKLKSLGKFYMVEEWDAYTVIKADYFEAGNIEPEIGVPANIYGYQDALSGSHYAGITAFSYDPKIFRSYIFTQLREPLEKGKMYCVKFYVSLADNSKFGVANLSAYLTRKPNDDIETKMNIYLDAQVKNNLQRVFKNTRGWELVCNVYTAVGKEDYLVIGNFESDSKTVNETLPPPPGLKEPQVQMAYYYIDDVSVVPIDSYSQCNCNAKKERGPDIIYSKSSTVDENSSPADIASNGTIYFGYLKTDLNASAVVDLDRIAAMMEANPSYRLKVSGF